MILQMRTTAVWKIEVTGPMSVTQTLNDNTLSKECSNESHLLFFPPCHAYSSKTDILRKVNLLIQFIIQYNLIL